ncbi:hypothetical protein [Brevundimonas sp. NIBR11]|uniref:hypothetical protein n=1 Tax=Brevundimonas sp. NIBR11 TaxID=3015999 RepID=UPI0022F0BA06|nr:hypothetical protein [Brevundimonas sp. NIBR11]WGM30253.1 hypothetical protein KKHFBJBL_00469 [Brevundimonas sp. NIBR11]
MPVLSHVSLAPPGLIASVPWTPAVLGGSVVGWWDALDAATFTLNGENVAAWANKGAAGGAAVQTTGANQPAYSASARNGRPGVVAGSGGKKLSFTTVVPGLPTGNAASTLAVVGVDTSGGGNAYLFGYGTAATGQMRTLVTAPPNVVLAHFGAANDTSSVLSWTHLDRIVVADVGAGVNPTSNLVVDGGGPQSKTITTLNTTTAGGFIFARPSGSGGEWLGVVQEILVFNRVLTTTERRKLEGYLAWRWSVVANLPSGHPYKSSAPYV